MNSAERLRRHFEKLVAENKLKPGDPLPKYAEICEQFDLSWTSVQRAYKKLEQAGFLRVVHGVGSFLNGGDDLDVDFCLVPTTFDFSWLTERLNRLASAHDLHLNIRLKSRESADFQTDLSDHRVVIAETDATSVASGPLLDYSIFDDYAEFAAQFKTYDISPNRNTLPFYMFTYQCAVRTDLEKGIPALNRLESVSSLDWWDEVARVCRARNLPISEYKIATHQLWGFPFLPLALLLLPREKGLDTLYKPPFFATEQGERIFHILDDCRKFDKKSENFLHHDILLNLDMGSWAATQAKDTPVSLEQIRFLPLMHGNRKIVSAMPFYLRVFANESITWNEKTRVWSFLKLLLSKEIQKEMTAKSGFISMRRDMTIKDHSWANRPDLVHFFPRANDIIASRMPLNHVAETALTTLYQAYRECRADSEAVRRIMDQKLTV